MDATSGGVVSAVRRSALITAGAFLVFGAALAAPAIATTPRAHAARRQSRKHPPNPYAGRTLPKGTPYAAEVRANIRGTVHFEEHNTLTTFNVCDAGVNQSSADNASFDLHWNVSYNQVTVPVATRTELGRAARRLHVPVTPTSNGRNHGSAGVYHLSGSGPVDTDGCSNVNYAGDGTLALTGRPVIARGVLEAGNVFEAHTGFLFAMPVNASASPASYTDATGNSRNAVNEFQSYMQDIPGFLGENSHLVPGSDADWNAFAAEFDITALKRLRSHSTVTIPPITNSGTDLKLCVSGGNDVQAGTCNGKYSMTYSVTLKRHSLYKTKRAYRRR